MRHVIKTTVIYLLLVGPPFLGLIGILELGRGLTAPRSIGGEWQLDVASRRQAAGACPDLVFDKQPTLKVSQSGLRAELVFADKAKTRLSVDLVDDAVAGSGTAAGAPGCDQPLTLEARLTGSGPTAELVGTLARPGCPSCPATRFRAARRPAAAANP